MSIWNDGQEVYTKRTLTRRRLQFIQPMRDFVWDFLEWKADVTDEHLPVA